MEHDKRPNTAELKFLTLSYNRFYDIFEDVFSDEFFLKDGFYRYSKIRDAFAVYAELLNYEPLKWVIETIGKTRPPIEAEIGSELFRFIRHTITHFPFFNSWNDVWLNKSIINWNKRDQSIDKFLSKYQGHKSVKYRFWEEPKKKMTYVSINFPEKYDSETKIYLKDMITEREGVKFCFMLMKQILDTQVEEISTEKR